MNGKSPKEIDIRHYCNMSLKFIVALALFYVLSSLTLSAAEIVEIVNH